MINRKTVEGFRRTRWIYFMTFGVSGALLGMSESLVIYHNDLETNGGILAILFGVCGLLIHLIILTVINGYDDDG